MGRRGGKGHWRGERDVCCWHVSLGLELLSAEFVSSATERASVGGAAAVDGVNWLNDGSFRAISSRSLGMGVAGLRDAGMGLGFLRLNVLN